MLICYIDESGTPDVPGNTSHYVLAGLAVPVDKWKKCEIQIQQLKLKYNLENAEIHVGWMIRPYAEQPKVSNFEKLDYVVRKHEVEKIRNSELLRLQRSPHFSKQYHKIKKNFIQTNGYIHLTFNERKQFVTEVGRIIGTWSFCRLFAECINKIHFNPSIAKFSIDVQAFEQVVSRFEQYLKIYSKSSGAQQFGLLVHDNNQTVSKKHTEMMKSYHKKGTFWTSIQNIIETPMFVDSQLTSMVQLADVCCYALRRYLENNENYIFNEIFKIADRKDGKVVGIRHFTVDSCNCQICQCHRY